MGMSMNLPPPGTLDLETLAFTCMVCGDWRPDAQISVQHRPLPNWDYKRMPGARTNLRYCNDRPGCVTAALVDGPWPMHDPIQPDHLVRLTAAADDERAWVTRPEMGMLAVGVMVWLRDGPAQVAEMAARYSEPDQVVIDTVRMLASAGLLEQVRTGRS